MTIFGVILFAALIGAVAALLIVIATSRNARRGVARFDPWGEVSE